MSKYKELVKKLKEIFQIDRPELDFGIYRILNAKGDEINDYLENTLKKKISDALATAGNANKEELEKQLVDAIKGAEALGVDPENIPKVKDLKLQIFATSQGANEHENAVFTHMLSFFSRYYDNGDFVSKRRYKGDTYAIPYAGEEVMLHWANKDQHYIKSGENFANYSFKLNDGRRVSFKLLSADVAKDNRKDNDSDRRFVLVEAHTRVKYDEDENEYDEVISPVVVNKTGEHDELVIHFEYKSVKKGTKQDILVEQALKAVISNELVQINWLEITGREPTEKKPNRTLLEKHLTTYTQRNTADYFIHKDLGGFLSNELDFYIKNEVMNLDNVQNAEVFSDIEKQLRMIQCLRSIAKDIISFLSQLENFQKKLWEKKKFVISTEYVLSLELINESHYETILKNDKQWKRWKELGFLLGDERTKCFLKDNKALTIETRLFDRSFKEVILSNISGIQNSLSGLLVNSDNYQALNTIGALYQNKTDLIYIDPPYNTNSTPILYKNEYKHSSWASLMQSRLKKSMPLLKETGVKAIAIDDSEVTNLSTILKSFGDEYRLTRVTVVHNPKGSITKDFNRTHEYCLFLTSESDKEAIGRGLEKNKNPRKMRRWGENSLRTERRLSFYPVLVKNNKIIDIGEVPDDSFNPIGKNVTREDGAIEIWPIDQNDDERRWNFGLDSIRDNLDRITIIEKDGELDLYLTHEKTVPKTVWSGGGYDAGKYGNTLLISMFGEKKFDFPKSINLVKQCIKTTTHREKKPIVIDYFAGSGTTGHAAIELSREDSNKKIHFVLVEQGEYFDTVTLPRIIKASYSKMWKDGKAESIVSPVPIFVKVNKLESYEDTLNNLELNRPQQTTDLFDLLSDEAKSDYLLNYMLDTESKGALLNTDDFKKPFDYQMKIAVDSAGASEEVNIDLVETFNYLIGIHVNTIESNIDRGYVRIEGNLPSGKRALILWRDCDKIQYDDFTKFANRFDLFSKQKTFDVIYVNGDHNLPMAFTNDAGEVTRTLKLCQIEPEFLEQMFAPDELA
jgi:adenine-specific DNA-methyltransferase